jgi:hypothetical protein
MGNKYIQKILRQKNTMLICLIIIIVVCLFRKNLVETFQILMKNPKVEVKNSPTLGNNERGLFATKDYKSGDIIEICPTLSMKSNQVSESVIKHHLFNGNKNDLLSLGYCSIINHSSDNQNCTWIVADDDSYIAIKAIKDIKNGEELFSNYGKGYWNHRKNTEI